MANHIGVSAPIPERFTLSNGIPVYVSYDEETKQVYSCIAPEKETNPLVKVHHSEFVKELKIMNTIANMALIIGIPFSIFAIIMTIVTLCK